MPQKLTSIFVAIIQNLAIVVRKLTKKHSLRTTTATFFLFFILYFKKVAHEPKI